MVAKIGVGYAFMIGPLYTAKLSSTMNHGFLTSLLEVFITISILLGYIINYALTGLLLNLGWRVMLGIVALPTIVIGLGILVMLESCRWLTMEGKIAEAKEVLMRTASSLKEVEFRL